MKYFIITLVLSTAFLQAQINYNKGYFVDNNDNRVDALLKILIGKPILHNSFIN